MHDKSVEISTYTRWVGYYRLFSAFSRRYNTQ